MSGDGDLTFLLEVILLSDNRVVSCRNGLVYFDRELPDRALAVIRDSLCRKCFFGLGISETLQGFAYERNFSPFVAESGIYQPV